MAFKYSSTLVGENEKELVAAAHVMYFILKNMKKKPWRGSADIIQTGTRSTPICDWKAEVGQNDRLAFMRPSPINSPGKVYHWIYYIEEVARGGRRDD
jgi:hypothetical protein